MMADEGTAIILVEQHTDVALSLAREAIVIERGTIALRGPSNALLNDQASLDRLIGLNLAT
jgi:branched-chain amino acid transport system ATP-binding protein